MRLPRDVSGAELAAALKIFGYEITRQHGSHIRLTTLRNGEHHLTVPSHSPLRMGTLSGILSDVAEHFQVTRQEITKKVFAST